MTIERRSVEQAGLFPAPRPNARPAVRALACLCLLAGQAGAGERLACHLDYGGETRVLRAEPLDSPYAAPAIPFGSYLLFRPVFEAGTAIKLYTYVDRKSGPALIHQAIYRYPPVPGPSHGFTGLQLVYEPVRDSELQYWCEMEETP